MRRPRIQWDRVCERAGDPVVRRARRRWRAVVFGAALLTCCVTVLAPSASASDWPRRLFLLYAPPTPGSSSSTSPVRDVAEAPGGGVFLATGDALGTPAMVSLLTSGGRLRRLAEFHWNGPEGGSGGGTAIGIGVGTDGSALVVNGWDNRLWRVSTAADKTALAGTGHGGFSGDGGPALSAEISPGNAVLDGVAQAPGGSIVFTDTWNNRLRRIRPDGIIETIAGVGPSVNPFGFTCAPVRDGGPALAGGLCYPSDVLSTNDGGLVIADNGHFRVRRIAGDGTISTIAGSGLPSIDAPPASDEGKPATNVAIGFPTGLAQMSHGDIVYSTGRRIDRIARDGSWHSLLGEDPVDYAGRLLGDRLTGISATREGGLLIVAGNLYYLAPRRTRRTLVRIRRSRVDDRGLTAYVEVSRRARATLQARVRGRVVASVTRDLGAGRQRLRLGARFADRAYDVRVTLQGAGGATSRDELRLYLGRTLTMSYVRNLAGGYEDENPLKRCRRINPRRIECRYSGDAPPETRAFTLETTGLISTRLK